MPKLSEHPSTELVKLLLLGDSKSGKTGSLVSLVKAGYKLRVLDFDNLLDILRYKIMELCPTLIDNVEFRTLRDPAKASEKGVILRDRVPKAWITAIKMLDNWKYEDVDLGVPALWGPDCILVVDSLSRLCDAAYDFHATSIIPGKSGDYDGRAVYGNAQDDVEKLLGMLTSPTFGTNVIVICHGVYMERDNGTFIFPQGVGQKLSPKIPQYFPNYIRYTNKGGKRTIQLKSDSLIHLGNARPNKMPDELPIETGLADFFAVLRDPPAKPEGDTTVTPLRPRVQPTIQRRT